MAKPKDLKSLIDIIKSTQALLVHFESSLAPPPKPTTSQSRDATAELPNPLEAVQAATKLLKSHTTTLSLLLINPPLTPSAVITKISDVNSGALNGIVAAASYIPHTGEGDHVGSILRTELKIHVRRLLGTWGDILTLILHMAQLRQDLQGKDMGPTESEKNDVLAATGVLWEACDATLKLCADGVVGLVVKKAEELRATLLDAIEELKEWGEDLEDDESEAEGSDAGDNDGFGDEDDIFGASNKLKKDDTELRELLETSLKKLKMISMLFQALIKRRLKTYPTPSASPATTSAVGAETSASKPNQKLDGLMAILKVIPDSTDDLASAFYDLDHAEVRDALSKCCNGAKSALALAKLSWTGTEDEFTAWSGKWAAAFDSA